MELLANAFIREQYGTGAAETVCLGGGFYGQVFLARLPTEPHQVVLKIYRFPGLAQREARQLQLLAKYGTVRMPAVYAVRPGDERISCDILSMEYIPGVNAGTRDLVLREECRVRIAQAMIENLLSYHDAVHPEGFGELDDERFASDWRDWYRPKAEEIFEKARLLYDKGVLERPLLLTFEKAMDRFSSIFFPAHHHRQADPRRLQHLEHSAQ